MKFRLLLLIVTVLSHISCNNHQKTQNSFKSKKAPYVILISVDGLRHDYIDIYKPPTLKYLKENGLHSKSLIPIFPSKTFPNHYSIITGMYAENHGLISNSFYGPDTGRTYRLGDSKEVSDGIWYGGEPLWVTAHKNQMVSASYFWVGSEAPINGVRPDYYYKYDGKVPGEIRVDQVIDWLKLEENVRPHFITLYFSEVDHAGHRHGPDSVEVKNAIFNIDDYINRLVTKLSKIDLPVNIILVSDHGMTKISNEQKIILPKELYENKNLRVIGKGSLSLIYRKNKSYDLNSIYNKLKKNKFLNTYKKAEIPENFNFKNNIRIPDIVLSPRMPYYIAKKDKNVSGGTHGYDPANKDMHGVFFAMGPNIKPKLIGSFENIHVYPFITKILGLTGNPKIDGRIDVLGKYIR